MREGNPKEEDHGTFRLFKYVIAQKRKTKSFCLARCWKSVGFLRRTNHSPAVVCHYESFEVQIISYNMHDSDIQFMW